MKTEVKTDPHAGLSLVADEDSLENCVDQPHLPVYPPANQELGKMMHYICNCKKLPAVFPVNVTQVCIILY